MKKAQILLWTILLNISIFAAKSGPRGRYSAAHDHFSNKGISPVVIIVFLSVIIFLLVAMIVQHHNHMKHIKAHNSETLKHHKKLVEKLSKEDKSKE